jgi:hypothetical protein
MPENPRPNPLQPAPWLQDLVRDRPVAPATPEVVKPEVKAPVAPVVPPVVPDLKKEISNIDEKAIDSEPAPSLDKAAPVETPAAPAATAPVTPAAVAPTVPVNPPPAVK